MEIGAVMVGTVVIDREDNSETEGLIVEVSDAPADEYGVRSNTGGGATITVADRNPEYPADDLVATVVFDPILRRSNPEWRENPMQVVSAYRQGSFRSNAVMRPVSRFKAVSED